MKNLIFSVVILLTHCITIPSLDNRTFIHDKTVLVNGIRLKMLSTVERYHVIEEKKLSDSIISAISSRSVLVPDGMVANSLLTPSVRKIPTTQDSTTTNALVVRTTAQTTWTILNSQQEFEAWHKKIENSAKLLAQRHLQKRKRKQKLYKKRLGAFIRT